MQLRQSVKKISFLIVLCSFVLGFSKEVYPEFLSAISSDYFSEEITFVDTLQSPYKDLRKELEQINIGAKDARFNGSILVGYKGKLIFEKAYGYSNKAIGLNNTLETPTQIASITKTFTGTAVMWLQQKGFLNIEDKVQQYIWEFPYKDITIEHLLSHQSGLKDYLDFSGRYWNSSEPMYNDEVLRQFTDYKFGLKFSPGQKFDYCNSNYAILGLIIERASGMKYKTFMDKYIFEPLHMDNTYVYDPADEYSFAYSRSYNAHFTEWKNTHQDGVYGDKGIFTTAEDLYKWDQALYSNKFINSKTVDNTFTPRLPWEKTKNYALGWRMRTFPNGEKYAYHTGWWHGYQGIFSRYMKDNFTVVILSNRYIQGITDNSELIYDVASKYLPLTDLRAEKQPVDYSKNGIEIALR